MSARDFELDTIAAPESRLPYRSAKARAGDDDGDRERSRSKARFRVTTWRYQVPSGRDALQLVAWALVR